MAPQDSIFVLVDLSYNCPFENWQKFKDYARKAMTSTGHQPGFTNMGKRADGSIVGFTVCKTNEDAECVFHELIALSHQGYHPTVHWYDLSVNQYWPIRCNCPTEEHQANYQSYQHHVDFMAQRVVPDSATYTQSSIYPMTVDPIQSLTNNMQALAVGQSYYAAPTSHYAVQPPLPIQYAQGTQYPNNSSYVTNSQGYPVNTANGLVRSEHNIVILKNLDPTVTDEQLLDALQSSVSPVKLDIRRSADKKRTISAIATFKSHKDAKQVAEYFHKKDVHIKNRKIRADVGKDSSPYGALQPTVVNGSTAIEGSY